MNSFPLTLLTTSILCLDMSYVVRSVSNHFQFTKCNLTSVLERSVLPCVAVLQETGVTVVITFVGIINVALSTFICRQFTSHVK